MAELRGLSVKVPIRFSEKAQKELYETCMGYKKLAEVRGEENAKLREQVTQLRDDWESERDYADQMEATVTGLVAEYAKLREICIDAHDWMGRALYDGSARRYEYESITERMRELGVEV